MFTAMRQLLSLVFCWVLAASAQAQEIITWSFGAKPSLGIDFMHIPQYSGPIKTPTGSSLAGGLVVRYNHRNRWNILAEGGYKSATETFKYTLRTSSTRESSFINYNWPGSFVSLLGGITVYEHHKSADYNLDIRGGVTYQYLRNEFGSSGTSAAGTSNGSTPAFTLLTEIQPIIKAAGFIDLKLGFNVNAILQGVGLIDYGVLLYYGLNKYNKYEYVSPVSADMDEILPIRKFGMEWYCTYYFISWNQYGHKTRPSTF